MIEHFKVEVIVIIYFFHSFKYFIKGLVLVYIDECFRIKCLFAQSISPIDGNSLRCEGLYYFFGTITIIAKILKYNRELMFLIKSEFIFHSSTYVVQILTS